MSARLNMCLLTHPASRCVLVMLARSTWGTGQDQCATIKRQLAAMLPGVAIFLDAHQRLTFRLGLSCDRFPFCVSLACIVALHAHAL